VTFLSRFRHLPSNCIRRRRAEAEGISDFQCQSHIRSYVIFPRRNDEHRPIINSPTKRKSRDISSAPVPELSATYTHGEPQVKHTVCIFREAMMWPCKSLILHTIGKTPLFLCRNPEPENLLYAASDGPIRRSRRSSTSPIGRYSGAGFCLSCAPPVAVHMGKCTDGQNAISFSRFTPCRTDCVAYSSKPTERAALRCGGSWPDG
jgi:hypothetical protein